MRDPRPAFALLITEGLLLLALAGWWCGLAPAERLTRLGLVMVAEGLATAPPVTPWGQAAWLYAHRVTRLEGMVGLLALGALIGLGEGLARRRQDVLGGFLLRWWTAGVLSGPLLLGLGVGYLVAPWPLAVPWVAGGLGSLVALGMYGLAAGRPYVP